MIKRTLTVFLILLATPALASAYNCWSTLKSASPSTLAGAITAPSGAEFSTIGNRTYATAAALAACTTAPAEMTFGVAAPEGYRITAVKIDGALKGNTAGTYTVVRGAVSSHTIAVTFGAATFTIKTNNAAGGTITPSFTAPANATRTVDIVPSAGWQISAVTVKIGSAAPAALAGAELQSVKDTHAYTISGISDNYEITPAFAPVPSATARIATTSGVYPLNTPVTIDGSDSASNVAATAYLWSRTPESGNTLVPTSENAKTATFTATAPGQYIVTLTVNAEGVTPSPTATVTLTVPSETENVVQGCTACHATLDPQLVADYLASAHYTVYETSCVDCHGGGHPMSLTAAAAACLSCHPSVPGHNGAMTTCITCHNPHSLVGVWGDAGCTFCHGYPPSSGAHAIHFGLAETSGSYGDVRTLEARFPAATPEAAPKVYAFGCANCHSIDPARHMDGTLDILLYEATAAPGSVKGLSAPSANYDPYTGTCSGVYCHSSGQAVPVYGTTPAWTSGEKLTCSTCHANPPAYPSGGAGTATANSHIGLADDGYTFGHFSGIRGPWHTPQHGNPYGRNEFSAPLTCQTCHYQTTDPANVGPNGFYWLDTTGNYQLPGMVDPLYERGFVCSTCHNAAGPNGRPAVGTGKVLPLRHVNGKRDVVFDPRETLPADLTWLPAAPNKPTRPVWFTAANAGRGWPTNDAPIAWNGTTRSWSLSHASYDPVTKTCSNTSCHVQYALPVWGKEFRANDYGSCCDCHKYCF